MPTPSQKAQAPQVHTSTSRKHLTRHDTEEVIGPMNASSKPLETAARCSSPGTPRPSPAIEAAGSPYWTPHVGRSKVSGDLERDIQTRSGATASFRSTAN